MQHEHLDLVHKTNKIKIKYFNFLVSRGLNANMKKLGVKPEILKSKYQLFKDYKIAPQVDKSTREAGHIKGMGGFLHTLTQHASKTTLCRKN